MYRVGVFFWILMGLVWLSGVISIITELLQGLIQNDYLSVKGFNRVRKSLSQFLSWPGMVVKKAGHTSSDHKLRWNELWIWKANEKDGKDLSFRKRSFSKLSMRSPNTKLIPSVNTKTFVNLENSPKRPLTDSNVVIRVLWASYIFQIILHWDPRLKIKSDLKIRRGI